MSPEVGDILRAVFLQMLTEVAPRMGEDYDAKQASVLGALMVFCADEYERAAEIRVRENGAMRVIFKRALRHIGAGGEGVAGDLREELERAVEMVEGSLAISELNRVNYFYRRVLVCLQDFCEGEDAGWARDLDREIWLCLRLMAEGRVVRLPGM